MDNRVQNGPARVATNNVPAANLAASRNAAPVNNVAAVNTLDATAFSSRTAAPTDLAELQAVISELEERIASLEARVAELQGEDPAAPASLPGVANAPANNYPAANDAVANAPAADIQLPDGVNLPALETVLPGASAPANDLGDDLADAPASTAATDEAAAANQTIQDLKPTVDAGRRKGLEAVEHVLKAAKLTNLTPAEEKIVERALKRVHDIGRQIGKGEDPGQFAAELFALKHTLADPAGAGKHPAVTAGAQTIAYIEDEKAKLTKAIKAAEKKLAKTPNTQVAREMEANVAKFKALVGIEKALDGAKLTGLTPAQEQAAGAAVDRLGAIAEAIVGDAVDPARTEQEVYKLGQALRAPGKPAEAASPVVNAGADVVAKIAQGKANIHARLRDIDDQIMGGAAPEAYAAERARLLSTSEALAGRGDAVKAAKLDAGTSKERREVSFGLAKAGAIADAIGGGQDANALRADLFVLRQTFQEPLASKSNPAIQAGAAALALIGQAEARNLAAREAIAGSAARGRDMRAKDPQAAALARQAEDLEAMRQAIEGTDFGGLTPEQEGRGAQLIDAMRAISQKVAAGDDYGLHRARYEDLAGQLGALRNWRPNQAPAPAPQPPKPAPTPASNDDDPVPAPAPAPTPADAPRPGKKYTVQKGDFLTKIAKEQLGDPNRFQEIVALNQDKYPSLKSNPNLIYAGWELTLPAGGGKPAKPAEAPAPAPAKPSKPKPTKPKPTTPTVPPAPPTPASKGTTDQDAVAWLRRNLDADGRITREKIAQMPKGPGKDALLAHFDALLFGFIDAGREGWSQLHAGDVDRLEKALEVGGSIKGLAGQLTRQVLVDRQVGDRNGDFKLDEADVQLYAAELRKNAGGAPKPAETKPAEPKPAPANDTARLRADLDAYLASPDNKDSGAVLHLLRTAPQYAVAATSEQKGRLLKQALDGGTNAEERRAALTVLKMADERGQTKAVHATIGTNSLNEVLSDLGDEKEGIDAAKLLLKAGAYNDEHVWKAMDDDAVTGLLKALGFKEPMIGTNDELRALPEAAKHHMIKELLGGNLTWGELAQAEWLNLHTDIKYRIPDYRNR